MTIVKLIRIVTLFIFISAGWAQASGQYSRVYILGDSLSDTGNLASIVGDFPAPPFYMNRVSNGPVAVEIMAARLGLDAEASLHLLGFQAGSNYAVAGANAYGEEIIDLDTQLAAFLASHGFIAPADALYVIFIGGNDIRGARDKTDSTAAIEQVVEAAARVKFTIETLVTSGARHFLVVNSPNIGVIPETRWLQDEHPLIGIRTRQLSQLYRTELHVNLNELQRDKRLNIVEFDLFKFFNKLLKHAAEYGFTNTTDACFDSDIFEFAPECNFGLNFDQFIFFDQIHPTARVHGIIGEALYQSLQTEVLLPLVASP